MLNKTFISLAIAAKALALASAVLLYTGSSTVNAEDCPMTCVPPPCDPDAYPDCWNDES